MLKEVQGTDPKQAPVRFYGLILTRLSKLWRHKTHKNKWPVVIMVTLIRMAERQKQHGRIRSCAALAAGKPQEAVYVSGLQRGRRASHRCRHNTCHQTSPEPKPLVGKRWIRQRRSGYCLEQRFRLKVCTNGGNVTADWRFDTLPPVVSTSARRLQHDTAQMCRWLPNIKQKGRKEKTWNLKNSGSATVYGN